MHQWGGGAQMPWADTGPVRRQLASSPVQHQEGKEGVGVAWEVTLEGGGVDVSLGKVLLCGNSGGALFWSRDMGSYVTNDA